MEVTARSTDSEATPCAVCPIRAEFQEARQQAGYYRELHGRVRESKEQLEQKIEELQAKIKELERQLFGSRSEKKSRNSDKASKSGQTKQPKRRGQQPGRPGPPRRDTSSLNTIEELHTLDSSQVCERCGLLAYGEFDKTEDSELIEITVRAHKRLIRRQCYLSLCNCDDVPGIVTAPGPPKLIPKGRYGISVWVHILLDKYAFLRPTHRLLQDLKTYGVDLSLGTVHGGLKKLAPLFEPIREEIIRLNLSQDHWHADETGWSVFVPVEGKVGTNWKLWGFQSASAVVFVLDPTRKAKVPQSYFEGVEKGTLSVDRYSAYKAMEQVKEGKIKLAFCWAHVRRDFLKVAKDWPGQQEWGLSWVEAIAELYHLNKKRLEAPSKHFEEREKLLRKAVEKMQRRYEKELKNEQLHPICHKALKSLRNHWDGLTLFVDHWHIPMDNNAAERALRSPVCARKQFYGSYALWAGHLAATLFSLFATLQLWAINPRTWLTAYLQACAEARGEAPPEAASFLPWNLSTSQRAAMAEPPET